MTTTLADIFPVEDMESALADGWINRQIHPEDFDLAILNYSDAAQFEFHWTPVTRACRGLIYRISTGEVLARPFSKFHNWDESNQPYPPPGPVIVADKMDGSLGILYSPSGAFGDLAVATRGSFASEQAIKATEILNRTDVGKSDMWLFALVPERTYLFEIIYPQNRIVVDYGDDEKLVLLDVLDTATGVSDMAEFDAFSWPHKVNRRLESRGFYPQLLDDETLEGDEGIVLLWPGTGFRVKMKRADYIELHRIVTRLDERKVWEAICRGININKFCEPLPDEFHPWVKEVASRILVAKIDIMTEAYNAWEKAKRELPRDYTRKQLALHIAKHPMKHYIFSLEDRKDIGQIVLATLKPEPLLFAKQHSGDVA